MQRCQCVVNTLLQIDKGPLNIYRSFGHTSVNIYWRVDNYGYQLWQKLFVLYRRKKSYPVNCRSEPGTENNEIRVWVCHFIYFRMMQIAVLMIIMLKPHLFEKQCGSGRSHSSLVKLVWYEAPSKDHREHNGHWTFVKHHCVMKYLLDKGSDECPYSGRSEGMVAHAWMPRELLGCAVCP